VGGSQKDAEAWYRGSAKRVVGFVLGGGVGKGRYT